LDAFVVMPNHVPGIVMLGTDLSVGPIPVGATLASPNPAEAALGATDPTRWHGHAIPKGFGEPPVEAVGDRATHASPLPELPERARPKGLTSRSLGAIIGSFKAAVTREVSASEGNPSPVIWHRNYYEHIIRSERSLVTLRAYVAGNPARREMDQLHPQVPPRW